MTSNLLHERVDTAHFVRVLDQYDPDVVVIQELGPESADVLAGGYPHHRLHPARDFTGRGVATRLDVSFGDIDMPGKPAVSAILHVGGQKIRLAGIHLLNPVKFPWWVTVRSRGRQLDRLLQWIDGGDGPVVVAGDFNASPRWPAYKRMAKHLTDLIVDHDPEPERTWAWRPGWPKLLRIDHVFGSKDLTATGVTVVNITGTDHAALVVDLEGIG
ncbi:MAG TPA: endonuclease/exonuclease/phosphatase family protein [Acidimicrobiia bacterium]|nr:endonuclease/exonuclease/phosphatase family protein [Acidimicrobiia bacterium]